MTIPLDDLLLHVKWEEEGASVPTRVRQQLTELARAQTAALAAAGGGAPAGGGGPGAPGDVARVTRAVSQLGVVSMTSARGVFVLRTALTGLAMQATGAAGPVGRLVSGLLLFGGGSPLVLGVAAGVAVVVGAYALLNRKAYEAAQAHITLDQSMRKAIASVEASPRQLHVYEQGLEQLTKQLRALQAPGVLGDLGITLALDTPAAANIQRQIDLITQAIERMKQEIAAADRELRQLLRAGDLGRSMALDLAPARALSSRAFRPPGFGAGQAPLFPAFNAGPAPGTFAAAAQAGQTAADQQHYAQALEFTRGVLTRLQTPQQLFNNGLALLQLALEHGAISTAEFDLAVKQLTEDMQKARKGSAVLGVAIIGAVSGAISAVISGGSAGSIIGGILGTVGGLVGITNPLLGAGIAGLGQIASSLGSRGVRIDEYGSRALEQLRGVNDQPQRIEFLVMSQSTGEIVDRVIYTLGQRRRTDAVPRVPGLILATA